MIRSKFKLNVLLPIIPAAIVVWIFVELRKVIFPLDKLSVVVYLCLAFFLFILVWVFGELRTKALKLTIGKDYILSRNFFGLGFSKRYYFQEANGFKTSSLPAIGNSYEYLYLFVKNKKVIKISEFYHENYLQMKQYIGSRVRDLGYERFNFFREIKEIFI